MGFPVRIVRTETDTILSMLFCGNREQKQGTHKLRKSLSVLSGCPARLLEAKFLRCQTQKMNRDIVAHESVFPVIQVRSGFSFVKSCVFRHTNVKDLTNQRSGSQIFDECISVIYVMIYVVFRRGPTGRSRRGDFVWKIKSSLYSSSSLLSSALSILDSKCSWATSG